jgi:LPS-assembly protein
MSLLRVAIVLGILWTTLPGLARGQPSAPPATRSFADLQVRSSEIATEILFALAESATFEDRTEKRPGGVAIDAIRLFFPGASLERSRLVSVDDRIVEEVRLFAADGGVEMAVVVRRPVAYDTVRGTRTLLLRVRPGALLAEAPPPETQARRAEDPRRRPRGDLLTPKVQLDPLRPGEGLSVDAEELSYDEAANEIVARGNVTIARSGSLLTADEVRIHRDTKVAEAIGNVRLTDPQGTLQTSRFHLELEDETGSMTDSRLFLNQNQLTVTGRRFEKSYGQTYHVEDGSFTTCQCGVGAPSWSIAGDEIDITLDGYGIVRGATFNVLDVPVLYFPVAAFPAKTSRQSGLLAPQFGFSKRRGFTYLQPLYLVLNKSADATVSLDVETEARIGGIGEYRYALGPRSGGVVNVGFFDETIRGNAEGDIVNQTVADPDIPDQRWSVTATMTQDLAAGFSGFVDSLAVSDDFLLREIPTFSFDPEYDTYRRTSRFSSTRGGLYRSWDNATLIAQAIYYQDFIQEDDLTLQRLPQTTLFASERFFDRRLKFRFAGEGVWFHREEGFDGPRVDLQPSVEAPFRWREFLRGSVGFGVRETAYHLTDTNLIVPVSQQGGLQDPEDLEEEELDDENPTRELFQATFDVGTEVSRVFEVDRGNLMKLKHTIEPRAEYLFIPDVDQDDLPIYDFVDRVNQRNLFSYGFRTRLLAKLRRGGAEPVGYPHPGDLSSYSGVAPAPFGDEETRGEAPFLGGLGGTTTDAEDPFARTDPIASGAEGGTSAEWIAENAGGAAEGGDALEESLRQGVIRSWVDLAVFQSYDLDTSLQNDRSDHFSDIDVRLRLSPVDYFSLYSDASIDFRDTELTASNVGFLIRDPRPRRATGILQSGERATLAIGYRFIEGDILEELNSGLVMPLADSLSGFVQSRYDAVASEFLEHRWGFRFLSQCRCWIFDVYVTDRVNPDETEVRAQITLVGLGSIGRPGRRRY